MKINTFQAWRAIDLLASGISMPIAIIGLLVSLFAFVSLIGNLLVPLARTSYFANMEVLLLLASISSFAAASGVISLLLAAVLSQELLLEKEKLRIAITIGLILGMTVAALALPFIFCSVGHNLSLFLSESHIPAMRAIAAGMRNYGCVLIYMIGSAAAHLFVIWRKKGQELLVLKAN